MLGTETYGMGGTISGGADSFTWAQTGYDNATIDEYGNNGTMGAALDYHLVLLDIVEDTFNDTGTDILGASDSILGGCDTYTDSQQHNLDSMVNAFGTTSAPYYLAAYGWDDSNVNDTGSSTLTTNGHVYATDTYGYVENSGSTITDSSSETFANGASSQTATAYDDYIDSDSGTITVSDTVTTLYSSFTVEDNHYIIGYDAGWFTESTTEAENWIENGFEDDSMYASGIESSTGDSYTYADIESSYDNYELTKTLAGQFNGVDSEINNSATSMSGNTSTGLSGSSYLYYTIGTFSDVDTASGDVTNGGVTSFAYSSTTTMTDALEVSSPPAATVTLESVAGSASTGGISSPANFTETTTAGHADTVGNSIAENLGSYDTYHAVHDGANEPVLDSRQGAGLGGGGPGCQRDGIRQPGNPCGAERDQYRDGGRRGLERRELNHELGGAPIGNRLSPAGSDHHRQWQRCSHLDDRGGGAGV